MEEFIKNTICDNLVNYSNAATSAVNLLDSTPTESHESLSFLMKNNILINFSIAQPLPSDKNIKKTEAKDVKNLK